jgi:hypothetical protein
MPPGVIASEAKQSTASAMMRAAKSSNRFVGIAAPLHHPVMAGLDSAIQSPLKALCFCLLDGRVKRGHDNEGRRERRWSGSKVLSHGMTDVS